jgi:hypothetical protein
MLSTRPAKQAERTISHLYQGPSALSSTVYPFEQRPLRRRFRGRQGASRGRCRGSARGLLAEVVADLFPAAFANEQGEKALDVRHGIY